MNATFRIGTISENIWRAKTQPRYEINCETFEMVRHNLLCIIFKNDQFLKYILSYLILFQWSGTPTLGKLRHKLPQLRECNRRAGRLQTGAQNTKQPAHKIWPNIQISELWKEFVDELVKKRGAAVPAGKFNWGIQNLCKWKIRGRRPPLYKNITMLYIPLF